MTPYEALLLSVVGAIGGSALGIVAAYGLRRAYHHCAGRRQGGAS